MLGLTVVLTMFVIKVKETFFFGTVTLNQEQDKVFLM